MLASVLRQPLVHFLLLGAALFGAERVVAPTRSEDACEPALVRELSVSTEQVAELAADWQRAHDRAPSAAELGTRIDEWINQEILYREGLALELDRGDPYVRRRVADKMAFLLQSRTVIEAPSDAELATYFADHAADYASEAELDFVHVFFSDTTPDAEARAAASAELLEQGASPAGMGERFSGGRRYRRRSFAELREIFGEGFVDGLDEQPRDAWVTRRSRFGIHIVRIEGRSQAREASLERDRDRVTRDWLDARRADAGARAFDELKAQWKVARP